MEAVYDRPHKEEVITEQETTAKEAKDEPGSRDPAKG
jgi:hypothetical protein